MENQDKHNAASYNWSEKNEYLRKKKSDEEMRERVLGFHRGQKMEAAIDKDAEDKEDFIFYKISK